MSGVSTTMFIPYMVPLYLGMTFDARSFRPGVQIFDDKFLDNPNELLQKATSSHYSVVEGMSDILNTLDISGDLAVKIKNGLIDVSGKGRYLKDAKDFDKSVTIIARFNYTSRVIYFGSEPKPIDNWADKFPPEVLGTHYVSSITYGIDMIAVAKFVAKNASDVQKIKGEVDAALNVGGKTKENKLDVSVTGKISKVAKSLNETASLEISYYGNLPLLDIPNSIEGLKELIITFAEKVNEQGLSKGVPRKVTLSPLTAIADNEVAERFKFLKNKVLVESLNDFEQRFADLNEARKRLLYWGKSVPFDIDAKEKEKIGTLLDKLNTITNEFHKTLWNLKLDKGPEQLEEAMNAYISPEGTALHKKYSNKVGKLIKEIGKKVDVDAYAVTSTWVHWGNSSCGSELKNIKLYDGYTVSSASEGIGGASQYACMPVKVDSDYDINKKYNLESTLAAVRYADMAKLGHPFKGGFAKQMNGKGVPCAQCYSLDATSITMLPADDTCPQNWETKYTGYLMSSKYPDGHTTEYICVDDTPSKPLHVTSKNAQDNLLALTQPLIKENSNGMLPGAYSEGDIIHCVVCSLRSPSFI